MPAAAATLDASSLEHAVPAPADVPVSGSRILAWIRFVSFGLWCLAGLGMAFPWVLRGKGVPLRYARFWHGICLKIVGIEVTVRGAPISHGSAMLVSNHVSYLDIIILGSCTLGSFVSKSEVRDWPLFGLLAKQQRTVFIERKRSAAKEQRAMLESRIRSGDRLILFPEGTTSDGQRTLTFKTSLFDIASINGADGNPVPVQPVTLAYTHLDGIPLGRWLRPLYAWYGDMELTPHMLQWMGFGRLDVEVTFHEPVSQADFDSRKHLAEYCEQRVADGLSLSLTGGRDRRPVPVRQA